MTIKKRLARANVVMILAPVLVAFLVMIGGLGLFIYLTETVYLPKLGLTLEELHFVADQFEGTFADFGLALWVLMGILTVTVAVSVYIADKYLTRHITRHITEPIDKLVAGIERISEGDLDTPIIHTEPDEFLPACAAVNLMADHLRDSMERTQEEQQRRREMFAGISHDLKSPLTSIRAYTEVLMEDAVKTPEARQKYLRIIRDKEAEIETMVEQLFAFSKMEMAEYPLHPQRVELRAEIGRIVKETAPQSLSVSLAGLGGEAVEADRALLERIVLNILENSRKYRVGPTAHVDISSRTAGEAVELRFDDDGPGVDAEKLGKLFDAFYRADPARKNPSGGSGLGLSIVRGSAERMGGKVWAENGRLGGLAVVLTLPAAKGEADGQDSDY